MLAGPRIHHQNQIMTSLFMHVDVRRKTFISELKTEIEWKWLVIKIAMFMVNEPAVIL